MSPLLSRSSSISKVSSNWFLMMFMITDFLITPVLSGWPPRATKELTELAEIYQFISLHGQLLPGIFWRGGKLYKTQQILQCWTSCQSSPRTGSCLRKCPPTLLSRKTTFQNLQGQCKAHLELFSCVPLESRIQSFNQFGVHVEGLCSLEDPCLLQDRVVHTGPLNKHSATFCFIFYSIILIP